MRQRITFVFLAIGCACIAVAVALLGFTFLAPPSVPVVDSKRVEPHYLTRSNGEPTRIFLLAAAPVYGAYPYPSVTGKGSNPDIHTGDPCFIINVTVRNDYTPQNPPDTMLNFTSEGDAYTALTAAFYDEDDRKIEATNVTPNYPSSPYGAPTIHLETGEIDSFTMYPATASRNVDHLSIVMFYVSSVPAPWSRLKTGNG